MTTPALTEGIDFYYSETGFIVFTERFHLQRGFCCGNGCRHCPYPFDDPANQQQQPEQIKRPNFYEPPSK